ncbi:Antibiotic biosynthesis monooxygenase [Tsuneonella dongtanensis]|uniref:Antibiotic biosynthesis monooxygenase n=1 Tax=Tsuneonella dongtanensis TaxID=692370 RepID=A0A1B2AAY2_9SPHN|nr:antibiotic biosynthesis monooxygenase [Tsuneonella dongtanensis]ANY19319.1 Antibiotic biosynthesis monooxygenase [Tsuneonella dongtanensis]
MYVVTVEFDVAPESREEFLAAVRRQAQDSLEKEADCHRFDVCKIVRDGREVFYLYELYPIAPRSTRISLRITSPLSTRA